jgi:hypothetical protein
MYRPVPYPERHAGRGRAGRASPGHSSRPDAAQLSFISDAPYIACEAVSERLHRSRPDRTVRGGRRRAGGRPEEGARRERLGGAGAAAPVRAGERAGRLELLPGRRGGRARLHRRSVLLLVHFIPVSLTYSVPLVLNRQCDQTRLRGGLALEDDRAQAHLAIPHLRNSFWAPTHTLSI